MYVSTVTGPAAPESLGITLPHEHLLACFATPDDSAEGWRRVGRSHPVPATDAAFYEAPVTMPMLGALNLAAPNRDNWTLDDASLAAAEAGQFQRAGGGTIVDQTSGGLGRRPAALRQIAEATGLNIVMGSGWFHPAWSPELADRTAESLADEIVHDIETGVDGVRAGVIGRIGRLNPAEAVERRLLVAVAVAAARTGAPVSIDRSADPADTLAVLDLIEAEGADLSRIAVGGCGALAAQPEVLAELLARGVFLQFDRLGDIPTVLTTVSDHDTMLGIFELAARGFTDQLLISQGVHRKIDLTAFGGNGYGFIPEQYAPYLRAFGAEDSLIHALTEANPQRLLALPTVKAQP